MTNSLFRSYGFITLMFIIVSLLITVQQLQGQEGSLPGNTVYENQAAIVSIKVCSRGCYQYLLKLPDTNSNVYLFPDSIPGNLKVDKLEILFSGRLTGETYDVLKPGPDDRPQIDFTVPKVKIAKISGVHQ